MKRFFCPLFFLIIFAAFVCSAQEKTPSVSQTKWTRIETENKEFSISFPPDFVVDAKTDASDQRYRIVGFENGVVMDLKTYKPVEPQKRLGNLFSDTFGNAKLTSFSFENFSGKSFIVDAARYSNTISLASNENFYILSITADKGGKAEISRFLYSLKLNGKPLYNQKAQLPQQSETSEQTVSLASLGTSAKVLEAFDRKFQDMNGKITYELNQVGGDAVEIDSSKKPAVILLKEVPKPGDLFKENPTRGTFTVKLRAVLLANGQIGDIAIISQSDKFNYKHFIDAVKRTKFIPAEVNGTPVNSESFFVYSIQSTGR